MSPLLSLEPDAALTAEQHSRIVRTFFENLLPEGQALDDAAAAAKVSKAETFGLLAVLAVKRPAPSNSSATQPRVLAQGRYCVP